MRDAGDARLHGLTAVRPRVTSGPAYRTIQPATWTGPQVSFVGPPVSRRQSTKENR